MKRKHFLAFLVFLFVLISFAIHAYAHIPCQCDNPPDQCTCFIQLGDKGLAVERIIDRLIDKGYLNKSYDGSEFIPQVKKAVIKLQTEYNLECTGWMDDETLDALLYDVLPDTSAKYPESYWDTICFVPTDGGQKHHTNPECSDMYNPRIISRVNAECLGIEHCRRNTCSNYSDLLTYSSLGLKPRILPDEYYLAEEELAANSFLDEMDIPSRSLPSDDKEVVYIGNKNSHVFHLNTCDSVENMKEKNKVIFLTRDEAIEKKYKPCSKCNP